MSSAIKILPHYTYEDYCKWEGRWELIDGIPYAMSPAPSPQHQRIVASVLHLFIESIKKSGCENCQVYDFLDVKVSDDTILQPDALIVCREIKKPFLDFPPSLVVEVLSPVTAVKDRNYKFNLYEHFGIPYYVIIDNEKKEIDVFYLKNGKYGPADSQGDSAFLFPLEENCKIEVHLKSVLD